MREQTVTRDGRTIPVPVITPNPDTIPVPVEPCEAGYKPQYIYRTEDAYMWRVGSRRWRLRFTGPGNVDSWTDHPTLRAARQHFTRLAQLDLTVDP